MYGRDTLLTIAVEESCFEDVKALIDSGVKVDLGFDHAGSSALMLSISCNRNDVFDLLIKSGADINATNQVNGYIDQYRPLNISINMGRLDFAEKLIKVGADFKFLSDHQQIVIFNIIKKFDHRHPYTLNAYKKLFTYLNSVVNIFNAKNFKILENYVKRLEKLGNLRTNNIFNAIDKSTNYSLPSSLVGIVKDYDSNKTKPLLDDRFEFFKSNKVQKLLQAEKKSAIEFKLKKIIPKKRKPELKVFKSEEKTCKDSIKFRLRGFSKHQKL